MVEIFDSIFRSFRTADFLCMTSGKCLFVLLDPPVRRRMIHRLLNIVFNGKERVGRNDNFV